MTFGRVKLQNHKKIKNKILLALSKKKKQPKPKITLLKNILVVGLSRSNKTH